MREPKYTNFLGMEVPFNLEAHTLADQKMDQKYEMYDIMFRLQGDNILGVLDEEENGADDDMEAGLEEEDPDKDEVDPPEDNTDPSGFSPFMMAEMLLRDEKLSDATEVAGSTWAKLKKEAMDEEGYKNTKWYKKTVDGPKDDQYIKICKQEQRELVEKLRKQQSDQGDSEELCQMPNIPLDSESSKPEMTKLEKAKRKAWKAKVKAKIDELVSKKRWEDLKVRAKIKCEEGGNGNGGNDEQLLSEKVSEIYAESKIITLDGIKYEKKDKPADLENQPLDNLVGLWEEEEGKRGFVATKSRRALIVGFFNTDKSM